MQKLAASESSVRSLEGSLDTSSKEKEEMALVLHKLLPINREPPVIINFIE